MLQYINVIYDSITHQIFYYESYGYYKIKKIKVYSLLIGE